MLVMLINTSNWHTRKAYATAFIFEYLNSFFFFFLRKAMKTNTNYKLGVEKE